MDPKLIVGSFARHILTTIGGMLVTKGILEQSDVEPLAGALFVIGSIAWSLIQKKKSGNG